jgi:hypothetical protein
MTVGNAEIAAWLERHAEEPLVKRAWLLAEGKGDVADKRDHLHDLMKLARGIGRCGANALPYDPRRRDLSPLSPYRGESSGEEQPIAADPV